MELKTFRRMYCHEFYGFTRFFSIFCAHKGYLLQELFKTYIFTKVVLKLIGNTLELRKVIKTFFITKLTDVLLIAGINSGSVYKFTDFNLIFIVLEILNE